MQWISYCPGIVLDLELERTAHSYQFLYIENNGWQCSRAMEGSCQSGESTVEEDVEWLALIPSVSRDYSFMSVRCILSQRDDFWPGWYMMKKQISKCARPSCLHCQSAGVSIKLVAWGFFIKLFIVTKIANPLRWDDEKRIEVLLVLTFFILFPIF